jgi:hypothetical protein
MSSSPPYHIKHPPSVHQPVLHGWMMVEEHTPSTSCNRHCNDANSTTGNTPTHPQKFLRHMIYSLVISLLVLSGCQDQAQLPPEQEATTLQQVQIQLGDELANSSSRYKGNYEDVIDGGSVALHYSFLSLDNTTVALQKDMIRFGSDWTINLALATGEYTFWANAYDSSGERIFKTDTSRTYTITTSTQSLNLGLQLNPILEDLSSIPTPIITQLTKPSGYFPGTPMEIGFTVKGGYLDPLSFVVEASISTPDGSSNAKVGNSVASTTLNSSTFENITTYQDNITVHIPADATGPLSVMFGIISETLQSGSYLQFKVDELFFSNELLLLKSFGELSLWLDASNVDGDYNRSLSDGDAVSVWKNLSGSGNDARQTVSGDQPTYLSSAQNGKGGVVFDREGTQSGEYLIIDDSETLRFNADEFSVFYVVKKTVDENPGDGGNPGILLSSGRAGASGSEYKNMLHFLYDDHFDINIDDDTTWKGGTTNGDFLGNYKIIYSERRNATTGSDTLNNYFDGLQESSFDIGNDYGTLTPNTPTPIHLGRKTYSLTSTTYSQYYLNGIVSEVIVFKKALADEERATVSSYLSSKWGLTSTVDSDGDGIVDASDPFPTDPSRWISFPEALRENIVNEFTPMQGLALWLDASNIDGNHNSGLTDGDAVSVWKNLSGHGIHLSQSIEADQPIYDSSDNSFKTVGVKDEFTQNLIASDLNSKLLNLTETDTELTIFMVRKDYDISQFTSNNPNILSYSNTTGTSFTAYRAVYGGTNDNKFIVHDPISWTNSYVHSVNSAMDERSINTYHRQTNSVEFYKNDPININKSDVGDSSIKPGLLDGINTLTLFDPSGGITVDLAEVLVFNKSLSDQDRSKITSYLANKWGLTTTVDSDGDGIVDASDPFPTDPSRWISFPEALRDNVSDNFTAINGLALWLDARNIDGNHNSSLNDGDTVSVWKDLGQNSKHLTQEDTLRRPALIENVINGQPAIRFDGSADYLENSQGLSISNEASVFVVTNKSAYGGAYKKILSIRGSNGSHGLLLSEGPGGDNMYVYAATTSSYVNIITNESWKDSLVISSRVGSNSIDFDVNGKNIGIQDFNYPIQGADIFKLGWAYNSEYWDGDIAEVIVFNRRVSDQEKVMINHYLSNKWNLTSTVDSDEDGIPDEQDLAPSDPEQFGENVWFEDFESYNDSNLNGQQDWNVITRNTSGEIYLEADFGFDGTRALKFPHSGAGVGNRAYKLFADAENPFPPTHQGFFVYEADIIKLCWGAFLGPAYDSDSDNVIDDSEQGPGFWIVGGCGGNKLRVRLGDGSMIEADLSGNTWFRIRFVMDLSANQGKGAGTVLFKSLTDGETIWRTDATLTNFNLKLDATANDSSNPIKWNTLWLHFEGATAGLDNIRIEH